jgi:hypothetical protein
VIVDYANGLHHGVHGGWANKVETEFAKLFRKGG